MTWTCVQLPDFSQQASSFVQLTAACFTTVRPDLPLSRSFINTISTVAVLQAATQLEVACLRFCVLRDVLLAVDSLTSPRLLYSYYTAVFVAPSQQPNAYWWRR